jgi:hypothetical protein
MNCQKKDEEQGFFTSRAALAVLVVHYDETTAFDLKNKSFRCRLEKINDE